MSKQWVCSKCGMTAISKCVWQRSIFYDDMWASLVRGKLGYSAKVQELDEETRKLARPENTLQVNLHIEVAEWHKIADADKMRIIDLPYVSKPWEPVLPHVYRGPEPVVPKLDRKAMAGMCDEERCDYKAWIEQAKDAKAQWQLEHAKYEAKMVVYRDELARWEYYESKKDEVAAHNKEARRLHRIEFIRALEFIRKLDQKTLDAALCSHSWLLDDESLTPQPCSLDTCTHATTGMKKKDNADLNKKEEQT